jgi:DNA-binding IclR family transcriptional regulator
MKLKRCKTTKIEFLVDRLNITRKTASKYLNELENIGILENIQIKNSKYFINIELFNLLRKGIYVKFIEIYL